MSFLSLVDTLFGPALPPPVASRARCVRDTAQSNAGLAAVFIQEYRQLRPRAAAPEIRASFYRFVRVNNTIRLREGVIHARLSDALEGAPEDVLHAIAHILIAKLYRKPVAARASARFRRYVGSEAVTRRAERNRQARGHKRGLGAHGSVYHLEEIFDSLNTRFFHGLLGRPALTWSEHSARRMLGHYDAAHNTIVVSSIFDRAPVPRYAVEYLVYHEMLHLVHPVRIAGGRRCVHSAAFRADEKRFPQLAEAKSYLKKL